MSRTAVILFSALWLVISVVRSSVPPSALRNHPAVSSGWDRGEKATDTGESAKEVKATVQALEARYEAARTLKAVFLERYSEGGRVVRVESGTVYFSRPGRMRWEYESPETKLFVADGKTVWFYVPADRTVSRTKMKESADWRTPLALLTRNVKLSRLCGRIDLGEPAKSAAASGEGNVVLRCLPRGASLARSSPTVTKRAAGSAQDTGRSQGLEDSDFVEVRLAVNPATGELSRVFIRQTAGVEVEFNFGNWQYNPPLAESLFHFQAPAGVAIVEGSAPQN